MTGTFLWRSKCKDKASFSWFVLLTVACKALILDHYHLFENGFRESSKIFPQHMWRRNTSWSICSHGISNQGMICAQHERFDLTSCSPHETYSIANLASSVLLRRKGVKERLRDRVPKAPLIDHETKLSSSFRRLSLIEPKTHAAKLAMERWMAESTASVSKSRTDRVTWHNYSTSIVNKRGSNRWCKRQVD